MLFKAKDIITKSYDVIIIGSGLAGMTAANRLAKSGRSVLLLEAVFFYWKLITSWVVLQLGSTAQIKSMFLMSLFTDFLLE